MSKFQLNEGTVPVTSPLPVWNEAANGALAHLIDPSKIVFRDGFEVAGALNGAAVPTAVLPRSWANTTGVTFAKAGGVIAASAATAPGGIANFDAAFADGEVLLRCKWNNATGIIGALARYVDTSNYIRAMLYEGGLAVQTYDGGVQSAVALSAFAPVAGVEYTLKVRCDADELRAWVKPDNGDATSVALVSSSHIAATGVGIFLRNTGHQVSDFLAGPV